MQNICCPQLLIVACGDTREHKHLLCVSWQEIQGNVILENDYVKKHCLREDGEFVRCPCYPKNG